MAAAITRELPEIFKKILNDDDCKAADYIQLAPNQPSAPETRLT